MPSELSRLFHTGGEGARPAAMRQGISQKARQDAGREGAFLRPLDTRSDTWPKTCYNMLL